jgi:hypothetical protein
MLVCYKLIVVCSVAAGLIAGCGAAAFQLLSEDSLQATVAENEFVLVLFGE